MTDAELDAMLRWFGPRLRELREAAGLTPKQFAERVRRSVQWVIYAERGRHFPTWRTVLEVCLVLGVSADEFRRPPDHPRPPDPPRGKGWPRGPNYKPPRPKGPRGRPRKPESELKQPRRKGKGA